jgi:hypothetical protein
MLGALLGQSLAFSIDHLSLQVSDEVPAVALCVAVVLVCIPVIAVNAPPPRSSRNNNALGATTTGVVPASQFPSPLPHAGSGSGKPIKYCALHPIKQRDYAHS